MSLKKIGDYKLFKVLDVLDYARIFVCINDKNKYLLFAEIETTDVFEKWVAVDIDDKKLYLLLSNKLSVQKAFINTDTTKYYIITHTFDNDIYDYIIESRMPENVLSEREFFVGVDEEEENEKLAKSALKALEKNDMPVLDLHFNPYTNNHFLPAGFLSSVLESIKTIFNRITNSRKDYLNVEPIPSSFLIRFQSTKPESVVEKNTSYNAFKVISNILTASSADDVSDDFVDNPKILKSSKDLVSCIAKENRNFDVIFADSKTNKPLVKNILADRIVALDKSLKDYSVSEENTDDYVGTLNGYDLIRKTFSFTSNTDVVFKGKLDSCFSAHEYRVPFDYTATIRTVKIIDGENCKETLKHTLVSIKDN